ncbi:uncharacterized protein J3D65DRAFT_431373 [Phyllosticta citribraziliensis]|uniref:Uncharacterized protein n=1 Tax=Phyllosticta citribraziliensis TaxID=989973 RepID=A0ABR1LJS3_9PEZI
MMPIVRPRSEEDLWSSNDDLSPSAVLSTIFAMPSTISYPGSRPTAGCDETCQSSMSAKYFGTKATNTAATGLPTGDSAGTTGGPSTFMTLTSSGSTASATGLTSANPQSDGGHSSPGDHSTSYSKDSSGPSTGKILAATMLPLIAVTVVSLAIWMILRRRHQRRRMAEQAEMKMHVGDEVAEHRGDPPQYRSPARSSERLTTSETSPALSPPAPVIISSVAPSSTYFSGLDTSEAFSVRSNSVRSHNRPAGFVMDGEFHEEPPPPYKPCSVPPLSREASIRSRAISDDGFLPVSTISQQHAPLRNPFADPVDEDDDQYSEVSDFSYIRNDRSERNDGRPLVHSAV